MAAVLTWLQANWIQLLTILLFVDQLLIGIFPQTAIFGSISGILKGLMGSQPPQVPPAA